MLNTTSPELLGFQHWHLHAGATSGKYVVIVSALQRELIDFHAGFWLLRNLSLFLLVTKAKHFIIICERQWSFSMGAGQPLGFPKALVVWVLFSSDRLGKGLPWRLLLMDLFQSCPLQLLEPQIHSSSPASRLLREPGENTSISETDFNLLEPANSYQKMFCPNFSSLFHL